MDLVNALDEVIDGKVGANGCPDKLSKCEEDVDVEESLHPFPRMWADWGWLEYLPLGTVPCKEPRVAAGNHQQPQEDGQVVRGQVVLSSLNIKKI